MKKILILLFLTPVLFLVACDDTTTTTTETNSTAITDAVTTNITTEEPVVNVSLSQEEVNSYESETVTIEFEYYLSNDQSESLNQMILAFEELYTNVDIVATKASEPSCVTANYTQGVLGGSTADLILTHQDYIGVVGNNVETLDKYMNSEATFNGETVGVSNLELNLITDFPDFDNTISFPFTRQTQLMFANIDLLSGYASGLQSQGIDITSTGYIPNDFSFDINDLATFKTIIQDKSILVLERPEYTMSTWFNQQGITYLNNNIYDIDRTLANDFMSTLRLFADNDVLDITSGYSDVAFTSEETIFAVSSSESIRYMIDYATFNVEILPLAYTDEVGATYFGSDFAISSFSSEAEKFYSWMFIKFVTDIEEDYMSFCLDYGYSPIYDYQSYSQNQEYIDYIALAKGFADADTYPSWETTDSKWSEYHLGMIQLAYSETRDNIYKLSYLLSTNSSEVENRSNAWEDYVIEVLTSRTDLDDLLDDLEDVLN